MPDNFIAVYDSPYTGMTVAAYEEADLGPPAGLLRVLWSDSHETIVPGITPRWAATWFSIDLGIDDVVDFTVPFSTEVFNSPSR